MRFLTVCLNRLCTKSRRMRFSLRNLCVLCVSAVQYFLGKNNHRDAENAEVTQRRSQIPTFRAKPVQRINALPDVDGERFPWSHGATVGVYHAASTTFCHHIVPPASRPSVARCRTIQPVVLRKRALVGLPLHLCLGHELFERGVLTDRIQERVGHDRSGVVAIGLPHPTVQP